VSADYADGADSGRRNGHRINLHHLCNLRIVFSLPKASVLHPVCVQKKARPRQKMHWAALDQGWGYIFNWAVARED
jgi:hypothetical protein